MRLSDTAVGLDHWLPVFFLDEEQSVPYPPTDWVADGEVAVGLVDSSEESVGGTGRIGPHQDRMDDLVGKVSDIVTGLVLSRQSTERLVEQLEVVVGVIRLGVPRAQHGSRGSPVVLHHTPRGWNPNHVCSWVRHPASPNTTSPTLRRSPAPGTLREGTLPRPWPVRQPPLWGSVESPKLSLLPLLAMPWGQRRRGRTPRPV